MSSRPSPSRIRRSAAHENRGVRRATGDHDIGAGRQRVHDRGDADIRVRGYDVSGAVIVLPLSSARSCSRPSPRKRSASRSRSSPSSTEYALGLSASTGPIPVWIGRAGSCPCRTTRWRPSGSSRSACLARNAANSASTACWTSRSRPAPQNFGQRIVNFIWLTERDNSILVHGVTLLREARVGVAPTPLRRSNHTVITHFPA